MPSPQPRGRQDAQAGCYEDSQQSSHYSRDLGLLVLPVAGPDGSAPRVIKTHAVVGYRTVDFDYKKRGTPPMFPTMQDTPSGDSILAGDLSFAMTVGGQQQQYGYAVKGQYGYVQNGPLNPYDPSNQPDSQSQDFDPPTLPLTDVSYGPRGNYSIYETGRMPFIPLYVNGFIYLANGDPNQDIIQSGLFTLPWAFATNGSDEASYYPVLPAGKDANSDLDLSNPVQTYWDTNIGPTFFSPSLIS